MHVKQHRSLQVQRKLSLRLLKLHLGKLIVTEKKTLQRVANLVFNP